MGFIMKLGKEDNHLHADFEDAYWSIDDVSFSTFTSYSDTGIKTSVPTVAFSLKAYPSREAKTKEGEAIKPTLGFGGPISVAVTPCLYEWKAVFESGSIFGDSIPLSEEEQKKILYQFVKDYLGLHDYCDVTE